MSDRPNPQGAIFRIDPGDDVAIALEDIAAGEILVMDGNTIRTREDIGRGHKVALHDVAEGKIVHKYGWPIGLATRHIAAGDHVHNHNLRTRLSGNMDFHFERGLSEVVDADPAPVFQGYRRPNGSVATRNEIWILCTVGCVARTAERIALEGRRRFGRRIDGIHAFTHPFGCSQIGDDLGKTQRILGSLAANPNAGGVLIVGLGCENNRLDHLLHQIAAIEPARLRFFNAQESDDELEDGLHALEDLIVTAEHDRRMPCSLGDLVLGLKCGGSDGLSGVSANPLVGRVSDRVVRAGGTSILTEIPELFGAEHVLMRRASSREVFNDIATLVSDFRSYFLRHGQTVSENPSPGNIAGGITTLEEKSLGAVQKAGRAPVIQVLRYGARTQIKGLTLLEAPGNDAVSATALAAAGAAIILFTTGRGTPLGFPVPTLKISSNTGLAIKKPHWIDFDAGVVLAGTSFEAAAGDLLRLVADTASGRLTRAEENGEREMAIWKTGVTL